MKNTSINELRSKPSRVLNRLKKEKATALTDSTGTAKAYLIDSVTFEGFQSRMALLEGIARGERAIEEGRVLTHAQAKKKMARWLKRK
jgi:predicted transcriptional regulator